jgi:hypothetical protein
MKVSPRGILTVVAFGLTFVVNPGYFAGCASDTSEPEKFEFGEAEMLDLLDEANAMVPFELEDGGTRYRLELTLEQQAGEDEAEFGSSQQPKAAFASWAHACGRRTFQSSAAACLTTSGVPLRALFSLYRLDSDGEVAVVEDGELGGELTVFGTKLNNGMVNVYTRDQRTRIELGYDPIEAAFRLRMFRTEIDGFPTSF